MAKINETLRQLRRDSGMTQEQVAGQLGVTRQALSGYESGRTQPGLDTLQRLADIYRVELADLIYGNKPNRHIYTALKILAIVSLSLFLIMVLAESSILWTINHFFVLDQGLLTDADKALSDIRFQFLDARKLIGSICGGLFYSCCIALLVLSLCLKRPLRARSKLFFFLSLVLGGAILALPLALTDPVYAMVDYILNPGVTLAGVLPFLAASLIIDAVQSYKLKSRISNHSMEQ